MAPQGQRRQTTLSGVVVAVAGTFVAVRTLAPAFISPARSGMQLRGARTPTVRFAEAEFLKVESTIELNDDEYRMALDQEIEAQRKKQYINGEVKKGNLLIPWKEIDEEALEMEARKTLEKNGVLDPSGEVVQEAKDSEVVAKVTGETSASLSWTMGEPGTKIGYIIERKTANEMTFTEIASYDTPEGMGLLIKEQAGYQYKFDDPNAPTGSLTYRVLSRLRSGDIQVTDTKEVFVVGQRGTDNVAAGITLLIVFAAILGIGFVTDKPPQM